MQLDVIKGARAIVRMCMGVQPGEHVLIVTDPPRLKLAMSLVRAAVEVGAETLLMCMQTRSRHGEEPPRVVAQAMLAADVVLAPTTYSLTHTKARAGACKAGARVVTMPMITEDMMSGGAMLVDYREVSVLTRKVAALLDRAKEVEVTSSAGTNLTFNVAGRRAHSDTGIFHNPGDFGNLPAGEAFIAPIEGTGEGTVVVDGSMVDKARGKITIKFRKGIARKISGGPARNIEAMLSKVGPKAFNLAEFGVGTNPKARLISNVIEDEKVLGTCHVALGDNSTFGGRVRAGVHVDGIFTKPTVRLDGRVLMEAGKLKI